MRFFRTTEPVENPTKIDGRRKADWRNWKEVPAGMDFFVSGLGSTMKMALCDQPHATVKIEALAKAVLGVCEEIVPTLGQVLSAANVQAENALARAIDDGWLTIDQLVDTLSGTG